MRRGREAGGARQRRNRVWGKKYSTTSLVFCQSVLDTCFGTIGLCLFLSRDGGRVVVVQPPREKERERKKGGRRRKERRKRDQIEPPEFQGAVVQRS